MAWLSWWSGMGLGWKFLCPGRGLYGSNLTKSPEECARGIFISLSRSRTPGEEKGWVLKVVSNQTSRRTPHLVRLLITALQVLEHTYIKFHQDPWDNHPDSGGRISLPSTPMPGIKTIERWSFRYSPEGNRPRLFTTASNTSLQYFNQSAFRQWEIFLTFIILILSQGQDLPQISLITAELQLRFLEHLKEAQHHENGVWQKEDL